ncbi:hypothetical protein EST38_g4825 [Candolleomyces aberdarensis]|uniref:G domain-containing protein n=1 Tax=Candolleomyces aberdarensis TaxID=2316362 RepID=A0A4Q2DNW6_9AGAR|nr:hypothetical protein EST38_g4825 [Candolleomyces aberdarensis]
MATHETPAPTFINTATQSSNPLKVGHSVRSCTDEVQRADSFTVDGRRIFLYDTPGFDDTNLSENDVLNAIALELEKQYRQKQTLHGIIYVHRISDIRVGGLAKMNFRIFQKLCGDNSLKNVVIMTNMWGKVSREEGLAKAAEIASMDDFFKPAIDRGAVMIPNDPNTAATAHEIMRHILKNRPLPLCIQEEIVDQHKSINKTGAGIALDIKLEQLAQKYERILKEQLAAAEDARKARDEELRKEQEQEAEKYRKLLEKLQRERREQAAQYQALQGQLSELMAGANNNVNNIAPAKQGGPKAQEGHEGIVSGQVYTLCNKQHGLYATVAGSKVVLREARAYDNHQQVSFD